MHILDANCPAAMFDFSGWMIDSNPLTSRNCLMWLKQLKKKTPIWEWFISPIKIVILGMVYYCFNHIIKVCITQLNGAILGPSMD